MIIYLSDDEPRSFLVWCILGRLYFSALILYFFVFLDKNESISPSEDFAVLGVSLLFCLFWPPIFIMFCIIFVPMKILFYIQGFRKYSNALIDHVFNFEYKKNISGTPAK